MGLELQTQIPEDLGKHVVTCRPEARVKSLGKDAILPSSERHGENRAGLSRAWLSSQRPEQRLARARRSINMGRVNE